MSLRRLSVVTPNCFDLLSVDLFDTILLRDVSLQRQRFVEISASVAARLRQLGCNLSPDTLASLRSTIHALGYRAVFVERPLADIRLSRMHNIQANLLGIVEKFPLLLREAELEVECKRVTANRPLLAILQHFAAFGKRIVVTSDTYYSAADLEWLLSKIVGPSPIQKIYSSSDIGLTKHQGALFAEVAAREGVEMRRMLHCGDNFQADIVMARAAGCQAMHLRSRAWLRAARKINAVRYVSKILDNGL